MAFDRDGKIIGLRVHGRCNMGAHIGPRQPGLIAPPPPPDAPAQDAGQFWKDFIRDTSPEFRKPTIEQLATFMQPTWQALIDGARYCEPQLREIIARQRPDVIVEDNVVSFPALQTAGAPFVRIVSCNPLEMPRARTIPPAYSGPAVRRPDRVGGVPRGVRPDPPRRPGRPSTTGAASRARAPLPDLEFIHASRDLNLYVYPQVADYTDRRPLDATWRRLDSSVRRDRRRVRAAGGAGGPAGRLGARSTCRWGRSAAPTSALMRRLVAVLADTPHRYIVSKGPQHADYELAPNMWGAEFLPQTKIVPLVDLVITHGGNNTTTEAFHFGKPMIVLPLFWDQYDNAQRVDETGFGVRLPTYAFEDAELRGGDRPAARRTSICAGGWPGSGRRSGHGTASRRPRTRSRRSGLAGAGDDASTPSAIAPRLRAVRATRYVTAFREGGSLPGPRRGRRRRPVRREVPRRRPGPARPRRGVARRRDRPRARAARARTSSRVDLDAAIADSEPHQEIHDLLVASVGRNIGLDFLPGSMTFNPAVDASPDPDWAAAVVWLDGVRDEPGPLAEEPEHARLARPDVADRPRRRALHPPHVARSGRARRAAARRADRATTSCCRSHRSIAAADERLAPLVTRELLDRPRRRDPRRLAARRPGRRRRGGAARGLRRLPRRSARGAAAVRRAGRACPIAAAA